MVLVGVQPSFADAQKHWFLWEHRLAWVGREGTYINTCASYVSSLDEGSPATRVGKGTSKGSAALPRADDYGVVVSRRGHFDYCIPGWIGEGTGVSPSGVLDEVDCRATGPTARGG